MKIVDRYISAHRYLIAGLVIALAILKASALFVVAPIEVSLTAAQKESEQLAADKANLAKQIEELKKKRTYLKDREAELTRYFLLKARLVDLTRSSEILNKLVGFSNVKIDSLRPLGKEKVSNVTKWRISISCRSSYDGIQAYLDYLDRLPYIVNVKKLDLSREARNVNKATIIIEVLGV